jgi:mannan endo-1,4-beta-mannosidase
MADWKRGLWAVGFVLAGCAGSISDGASPDAGPGGGRGGRGGSSAAGSGGRAGAAAAGSGGSGGGSTGPHTSYYVRDGALYDSCGEQVILRGVNHPTLYVDRSGEALPEIAKTGANSVRLFWFATHNVAIEEAETAIMAAIAEHMVPILEMHDSTCAWDLDDIVSYWTSDDAVALIERYQKQLIVNIANEPSAPSSREFLSKYSAVVETLRGAGIHVPLMIDGSNCGRDYEILLGNGAALLEADPDHNLIFSAHLYDPLSASELGGVYDDFARAKLPFVVGEFANKSPPGCGAALSYGALIAEAEKRGVGWLAWSWGNDDAGSDWNTDCGEFDMTTTFAYDSLRDWGKEVAVTHEASIMNTAKRPYSLTNGKCR